MKRNEHGAVLDDSCDADGNEERRPNENSTSSRKETCPPPLAEACSCDSVMIGSSSSSVLSRLSATSVTALDMVSSPESNEPGKFRPVSIACSLLLTEAARISSIFSGDGAALDSTEIQSSSPVFGFSSSVHHLRKVLSIIESGIKDCDGQCYARHLNEDQEIPDHECSGWKLFESTIPLMIFAGIEHLTSEHSLVIAGIVQLYFDKLNPAAAELEASMVEETVNPKPRAEKGDDKRRTMLKQKLFLSKHTYYEDDENEESDSDEEEEGASELQETNWIDEIVVGLATHAVLARQRITDCRERLLQQTTTEHDCATLSMLLQKSIDSFYNCARCLVYIGEAALRRLPNNPRVVGFCSRLVLCLTQLFLKPDLSFYDYTKLDERTYLKAGKSLIDPNRYADSVLAATKNYRDRHFPTRLSLVEHDCSISAKEAIETADLFLRALPDEDVQDLIWCFFTKDLVNTSVSRCGYGDIMIYWGLPVPVSPLDPLLFFYTCNLPEDELTSAWETDEEGAELRDNRLFARYDFSLVLLLYAWQAPWSIESHHSFQKPFRDAVRTLFLCANRMNMPTDIVSQVCKYLPRDGWPDERVQCFSEECLEKQANKLLHQKLIRQVAGTSVKTNPASRSYIRCPDCSVASYCCKDHRQSDYRDGHKGACGNPPCKIPGQKEMELLSDVLCLQQNESAVPIFNDQVQNLVESVLHSTVELDDDDSGSWESIDSDEEEEEQQRESITDVIHKFFERECYRKLDS